MASIFSPDRIRRAYSWHSPRGTKVNRQPRTVRVLAARQNYEYIQGGRGPRNLREHAGRHRSRNVTAIDGPWSTGLSGRNYFVNLLNGRPRSPTETIFLRRRKLPFLQSSFLLPFSLGLRSRFIHLLTSRVNARAVLLGGPRELRLLPWFRLEI